MQQQVIVLVCVLFALFMGWSLFNAWSTGDISSRGWTFQKDKNPSGFWFVAVIDFGLFLGSWWFALHALGLVGDLPTSITIQLPRFH
jgi:hypothetical protein